MRTTSDIETEGRLATFVGQVGGILGHQQRRESFAMYAMGLMGDGDRKSVEPIAARACGSAAHGSATHQRLLHFIANSDWDDNAVRLHGAKHALAALMARGEQVECWVFDDTGFLKQGKESPGVQRQYTGSAGKVTNCQTAVSLSLTTGSEHVCADFALYLPESWANDKGRRKQAHIPDDVVFRTKPEIAIDMIKQAVKDGLPPGVVLADSGYGDSSAFRNEVRSQGLEYAVGVHGPTRVFQVNGNGRIFGKPIGVAALGKSLSPTAFRTLVWRQGTQAPLSSRFATLVVVSAHDDGIAIDDRERILLLIEWPEGEDAPSKFTFAALDRKVSRKELVRIVKERYRTERLYQDLKGELGLDHFEGRTYRGWNHHVSVVLSCFSFILAERAQRFSPQRVGKSGDRSIGKQAGAALRGLVRHNPSLLRPSGRALVASVPAMPSSQ